MARVGGGGGTVGRGGEGVVGRVGRKVGVFAFSAVAGGD